MKEYPTYPTLEGLKSLHGMDAHRLYQILCDGLTVAEISRVDRAINIYTGVERETAPNLDFERGAGLDPEWQQEMEVDEYAADHGISEDEARRQLEAKAYWG